MRSEIQHRYCLANNVPWSASDDGHRSSKQTQGPSIRHQASAEVADRNNDAPFTAVLEEEQGTGKPAGRSTENSVAVLPAKTEPSSYPFIRPLKAARLFECNSPTSAPGRSTSATVPSRRSASWTKTSRRRSLRRSWLCPMVTSAQTIWCVHVCCLGRILGRMLAVASTCSTQD